MAFLICAAHMDGANISLDKTIKKPYHNNMKFDLNKDQIVFLASNDRNFLDALIERVLEIGDIPSESVVDAAQRIALKHGPRQKIRAIKELREWSGQAINRQALRNYGRDYTLPDSITFLTLRDAKELIERTYPPQAF